LGLLILFTSFSCGGNQQQNKVSDAETLDKQAFLDDLKQRTFNYFWEVVDSATWQSDDRYPTRHFVSIAATGFALPAYIIGVENKYILRSDAAQRTLKTLQWLWNAPMGVDQSGTSGHKGFYYHFLNYDDGTRFKDVELSSVDTGLLMAGILVSQSYFDGDNANEQAIQQLADSLFLRVEWNWMMDGQTTMSMGWKPESGFIEARLTLKPMAHQPNQCDYLSA